MKHIILTTVFIFSALFLSAQSYHPWRLLHNGNSFGLQMKVGTKDNNSLLLLTNNSVKAKLDSLGNFGLGTQIPLSKFHLSNTTTTTNRGLILDQYGGVGSQLMFRRAVGTEATPTAVNFNQPLGNISFYGYDGSNFIESAKIEARTNPGISVLPTRLSTELIFSTNNTATPSVMTEAMKITGSQNVTFGGSGETSRLNVTSNSAARALTLRNSSGTESYHITFPFVGNSSDFMLSYQLRPYTSMLMNGKGDVSFNTYHNWGGEAGKHLTISAPDKAVIVMQDSAYYNGTTQKELLLMSWDDGDLYFQNSYKTGTLNSYQAPSTLMSLTEEGGLSVGSGSFTSASGIVNAETGFRVNDAATNNFILAGNGTNITLQDPATVLSGTYWKLGGNTTGANTSIGTDDDFTLDIERNNIKRIGLESGFTRFYDDSGGTALSLGADNNIAAIPLGGSVRGYKLNTDANNFTDTLTAASGSAIGVVSYDFKPDTIAATNSSVTHQNAYNVRIGGPPVAGTNVTITNSGGLWVDAGRSRFDDQIMLANSGVGGFPQLAFNGGLDTGFGLQSSLLQVVYNDSSAIRINNFGEVGINDDPTSGWALTVNATDGTGDGALKVTGNHLYTLYNNEGPALDMNYFDSDGSGLAEDVFKVNTSNGSERIILGEDGGVMKTLIHQQLDKVSSEVTTTTTATLGEILLVDCSGGVVEVDVPASPSAGDWFAVSDTRGNAGTSNVTVDFTGATVNLHASSQDYVMNVNNGFVRFTYVDATVGWIITGEKN